MIVHTSYQHYLHLSDRQGSPDRRHNVHTTGGGMPKMFKDEMSGIKKKQHEELMVGS